MALDSWNETPALDAITSFVEDVTDEGGQRDVPPEDRVAVFDNDGTLWCEKPMPIELGFIVRRFAEMAAADASLRQRQPWQAAAEGDLHWLGSAVEKHYQGDESDVKLLIGAITQAFAGLAVDEYAAAAEVFLRGEHPTLGRPYTGLGYQPMVELLRHLEDHEFTTYIASGGDRDFMRPIAHEMYGIPAERVIGSSNGLRYVDDEHGGTVSYAAEPDFFDDGPVKPVRIWSRVGRRPILAAGNSNGDIPMLRYAGGPSRPALRLLVAHDDEEREFAYTGGAEESLERAHAEGWTVVSVKADWATVFGDG